MYRYAKTVVVFQSTIIPAETGVVLCVRLFLKKSGWICERKMF